MLLSLFSLYLPYITLLVGGLWISHYVSITFPEMFCLYAQQAPRKDLWPTRYPQTTVNHDIKESAALTTDNTGQSKRIQGRSFLRQ